MHDFFDECVPWISVPWDYSDLDAIWPGWHPPVHAAIVISCTPCVITHMCTRRKLIILLVPVGLIMSERIPLTKEGDYDFDELDPRLYDESHEIMEASPTKTNDRALILAIVALLFVNILAWAFASIRMKAIYHAIEANLDVAETRSLPRPDTRNGLEKFGY